MFFGPKEGTSWTFVIFLLPPRRYRIICSLLTRYNISGLRGKLTYSQNVFIIIYTLKKKHVWNDGALCKCISLMYTGAVYRDVRL